MFYNYAFRIKCNNNPTMIIRVIAENYDNAVSYAKVSYGANNCLYADDRLNVWEIFSI